MQYAAAYNTCVVVQILLHSFLYQRPALHAYFTVTVPLAKITSDQIQHRSQNQRRKSRNRQTLKQLKLTFRQQFTSIEPLSVHC